MAPTRLPSPVRIGPYEWTFSADKREWDKEPDKDKHDAFCDGDLLRILVNPVVLQRNPLHVRVIIMHEIMHAVFTTTHGEMDMRDPDEAEESFVMLSAPLMLQVLRDNPHIVEWLTA